jgi:TetR/AcrR family transcriptional regulator
VNSAKPPTTSPLPRGPHPLSADAVGADQRRRLLEALPCAVAEHGYDRTTVEHIVKLAQVRRNSFYEQFEDKQDCFGIAYEVAQERLLGVLTLQCYIRQGVAARIGAALQGGLELLRGEPDTARLLVVEAPAAGERIAARHHEWLDRYGRMLRLAAVGRHEPTPPPVRVEPAIVGGIVSRVKQLVLAGETDALPCLRPELLQFALSFYRTREALPGAPSGGPEVEDLPQPQSPESASVLEPV